MLNSSSGEIIAESQPLFGGGMPWRIRLGAIQWLILSAGGARDRDHARHRLFRHAIPRAGAGSRRARTQQQRAAAVAAFRPATARSPARPRRRRGRPARGRGPYRRRVRKQDVDIERARDAAHEARGAAACRRPESLERQGLADQFVRDVAGAGREHHRPALLPGVHVGQADARRDRRAGREQGDQGLDDGLRAKDHRPQRARSSALPSAASSLPISRTSSARWRWTATPRFR